jgi:mercuric ion binding protein
MMNVSLITALALGLLAPASIARAGDATAKTTLTIKGMTCGGCAAGVRIQLKKTQGVTAYEVSFEKGEAEVTYDPAKTTPEKIAASVSKTGFAASVKKPGPDKVSEIPTGLHEHARATPRV